MLLAFGSSMGGVSRAWQPDEKRINRWEACLQWSSTLVKGALRV